MIVKLKDPKKTEGVFKQVIFLLWQAAGGPSGMGFLQDRGPDVTVDQVFDQAYGSKDYSSSDNSPGNIYMDYVFGRCLKTHVKCDLSTGTVEVTPDKPKETYQDWGLKYGTALQALQEAVLEVGAEIE